MMLILTVGFVDWFSDLEELQIGMLDKIFRWPYVFFFFLVNKVAICRFPKLPSNINVLHGVCGY